jgi:hypothetical protein
MFGKALQNPSVNNLEMLPKHQAKFISNSIFSLEQNLLSQISGFIAAKEEKVFRFFFLANFID